MEIIEIIEKKYTGDIKMEKGTCSWCTKPGIIFYTPLETDFEDPRINECIERLNVRVMANKLIEIAKGIFACKECVSVYNLRIAES